MDTMRRIRANNTGWTEDTKAGGDTAAEARTEEDIKGETTATAAAIKDASYAARQAAGPPSTPLRNANNARIDGAGSHEKRGKAHHYRTSQHTLWITKVWTSTIGTTTATTTITERSSIYGVPWTIRLSILRNTRNT